MGRPAQFSVHRFIANTRAAAQLYHPIYLETRTRRGQVTSAKRARCRVRTLPRALLLQLQRALRLCARPTSVSVWAACSVRWLSLSACACMRGIARGGFARPSSAGAGSLGWQRAALPPLCGRELLLVAARAAASVPAGHGTLVSLASVPTLSMLGVSNTLTPASAVLCAPLPLTRRTPPPRSA
jgi:hypothetical protein